MEKDWLDVSNLNELPDKDWCEEKVDILLERIESIRIEASVIYVT